VLGAPSTLRQPPPRIGNGVKHLTGMMSCVFVQFYDVDAACIDRYNDVQPHGSDHLHNISVTNGDFTILKNLKDKVVLPSSILPSAVVNEPARILTTSSMLNKDIIDLYTTPSPPGESETPWYSVLDYEHLGNSMSSESLRKSYVLIQFLSPIDEMTCDALTGRETLQPSSYHHVTGIPEVATTVNGAWIPASYITDCVPS
jgi:hypothetical protein